MTDDEQIHDLDGQGEGECVDDTRSRRRRQSDNYHWYHPLKFGVGNYITIIILLAGLFGVWYGLVWRVTILEQAIVHLQRKDVLDGKLELVHAAVTAVRGDVADVKADVADVRKRVDRVEAKVGQLE